MKIDRLIYINWMFLMGKKIEGFGIMQTAIRIHHLNFYSTTMTTTTLDDWRTQIPKILDGWMKEQD